LSSSIARVEDLVWMFISDKQPPMTGPIVFRAKATLNPGKQPFLNRVKLAGDFGISDAQYSQADTQKNIDVLSARAQGQADKVEDTNDKLGNDSYDPGRVVANIKGHVVLDNTVAHLSDVSFAVPGALAKVSGTYGLTNEHIDLQGYMRLDSELSKTTTGVKSFLLKVAQPFMKKGHHNASVVAIKIGGTYQNPTYAVVPKAEK
jgi:AsmA-like C-terminal region